MIIATVAITTMTQNLDKKIKSQKWKLITLFLHFLISDLAAPMHLCYHNHHNHHYHHFYYYHYYKTNKIYIYNNMKTLRKEIKDKQRTACASEDLIFG